MSNLVYKVSLPALDVPRSWSNYTRDLLVKNDIPKSNSSVVLYEESLNEDEFSIFVEAPVKSDLIVKLDLNNDEPKHKLRFTVRESYEGYQGVHFSVMPVDVEEPLTPPPSDDDVPPVNSGGNDEEETPTTSTGGEQDTGPIDDGSAGNGGSTGK